MVRIELPQGVEDQLREEFGDLEKAAREALLAEAYRQRKLSIGRLGELLGIGVIAAHGWRKVRNNPLNYSFDDFLKDCDAIDRFREKYPRSSWSRTPARCTT